MHPDPFPPRAFAAAVTDLGDGGLIAVLTLVIALYLLLAGYRRGALAMLGAVGMAAGGIALLKLLLIGCHLHFGLPGLRSPSGHAALSAAAYGTLLVLLTQRLPGRWRLAPILVFGPLILAIAATRIYLGYHSWQETLTGLAVGLAATAAMWGALLRGERTPPFRARWAVTALVVTVVGLHGTHVALEAWLQQLALSLRKHTPCAVAHLEKTR